MSSSASSSSSSSSSLEPTLYTLLPSALHQPFLIHLSLYAIHNEPLEIFDRVYTTSNPIVPGQLRNLRLRSRLRPSPKIKGKEKENHVNQWIHSHSLSYISNPLRSQEYSGTSTRAVIGLDILSEEDEWEIKDFISSLGFDHSHSYTQRGHLFHMALPTNQLTLQLSITHLTPLEDDSTFPTKTMHDSVGTDFQNGKATQKDDRPWLIQLYPSKPVSAVSNPGELNYSSLVELMQDFVENLGFAGLKWGTGGR
ncbi:uncharacterized protein I303_106529 [Kwoniella dejecticola CBS 10117]|uniref:Mediator of RNA polymerase II transcription subunit 18 n=1 Tax=Kwoniella dejecticola CBS 10117 TaxID=1296121 RepID=A0A1A5ZUG1_9TREE|nr:uncharacterized protein I303_08213 [Kwoniella dejecticola CBS 10117]OBR81443.1 hypothetical protein I303_08213 [Kwoniella dejecticola CBS 10117]